MSDQSPQGNDSLRLSVAQRVDAICYRFEKAWKNADPKQSPPRIEDFLKEAPESDRGALLRELIPLDAEYRRDQGGNPQAEEYLTRLPDLDPQWLAGVMKNSQVDPSSDPELTTAPEKATPTHSRRVRCPHCHNPIQLSDNGSEEILCPGCGSSFRIRETTQTSTTAPMRQLGKFQLLDRVGLGAFGAVWRARDTELDRIVALKIPHTGLLTNNTDLERFHREARAAAQLRHPGIVTVHEVVTLDGLPTIVSDFIEGVPLRDFLEVRKLTFREMAALMADVADAVDYAHSMGLVHRDLKPANIMVESLVRNHSSLAEDSGNSTNDQGPKTKDPGLRPLVMDFGLALREEAEVTMTMDGHILGTPAYMSPEQAAGKSHQADRRSDVYSLGVIFYQMLTGELPFRGSKMMIIHQVLHEDPRPPRRINDKVPRDLETICLKALAKAPGRRYASAREMADDLRRYLNGEPIQARTVGRMERAARWVQRNAVVSGLLAAVILVLLGGAAVSLYFAIDAAEKAEQARRNESKAIEKEAETIAAKNDLEHALARSLLRNLGLNRGLITDPEIQALWELAGSRGERVWKLFVADAVQNPVTTRQLRSRAEVALHAAVGLEPDKLAQVKEVLINKLQDPDSPEEQRIDLALIAAGIGDLPAMAAADVARTLRQAVLINTNEFPQMDLFVGLAAVAAHLDPAQVAPLADTLLQNMTKKTNELNALVPGFAEVVARLEPAQAEGLADVLVQTMTKTTDPVSLNRLANCFEMAARLKPRATPQVADALVKALTKTTDPPTLVTLGYGLGALASRLEPQQAAAAADSLLQAMAKTSDNYALHQLAYAVKAVAARLEPPQAAIHCAAAADALLQAMTKTTDHGALLQLASALAAVAARLEPKQAATCCAVAADAVLQTMSKTANPVGFHCFEALAPHLEPQAAARVADTLLQSMFKTIRPMSKTGREASTLMGFAFSLAAVTARLEPQQAANRCAAAADTLLQTMAKTTRRLELIDLASGLARVAVRLEPPKAAPVADALLQAITKTNDVYAGQLARSLGAVAARLEPKQAATCCAVAADAVVQAITKNTDPRRLRPLASGLAALAPHLEPHAATRVADTLLQTITKTTDLDALGQLASSLGAVATRLEPQQATTRCAATANALFKAITKTTLPNLNLTELASGFAAVSAHLEPPQAAQLTVALLQAMAEITDPKAKTADFGLQGLTSSLAASFVGVAPAEFSRRSSDLAATLAHLGSGGHFAANLFYSHILVEPLPCRFSTHDLVEFLKQPTFVGPTRRVILDQLENRYGRKFVDHWEFVRFAQEKGLGLDFTSPPRRLAGRLPR